MFSETIDCETAKDLINNQQAQLVDVRSKLEFAQGALPNAINVPLQTLIDDSEVLDKTKPVVLYCVTGTRTKMAKLQLDTLGFEQVYDLGSFRNYLQCH